MSTGHEQDLIDTIIRATAVPRAVVRHDAFATPVERKHALIIGTSHLNSIGALFPNYALDATVIVPANGPALDHEHELERAFSFEDQNPNFCRAVGSARDLSGFDNDSVDYLIICTPYAHIRDEMLKHAWRVVKEFGKVLVFSSTSLLPSYFQDAGIASVTHFELEGVYAGTLRKSLAIYTKN